VIDLPILNSLNLCAPSSLRTCFDDRRAGDLDDTELVDMSASYLASGLSTGGMLLGVSCGTGRWR
jgi:hypothetical protein